MKHSYEKGLTAIIFLQYRVVAKMALEILGCNSSTRAVSYLPNIFKCLGADALGRVAFFREKSSCLFHLLQILRSRKVFRVNE